MSEASPHDAAPGPRPSQSSARDHDALLSRRLVRMYALILGFGLFTLALDVARSPFVDWMDRYAYWPRLMAAAAILPILAATALGWLKDRALLWSEPFVYAIAVADYCAETLLARAPTFEVHHLAILLLFSRACFVPTRPRLQLYNAIAVVSWVGIGAWLYVRTVSPTLSPHLGSAATQPLWFQWLNVMLVLGAIAGLTVYVASSIGELRERAASHADRLGPYLLSHKIGEGGMGIVWQAKHALLGRPTAIKVIRSGAGDTEVARFEREVKAASHLSHANVVAVFDYGRTEQGRLYYAMELLDGLTLQVLVDRHGPLPQERAAYVLDQLLGALEEAHGRGLIHRDLKPANVMLAQNGSNLDFVKLLDFGLVHLRRRRLEPHERLTHTGTLTGTPLYMAPETITGEREPDRRTDIYSLGALAYCLIVGAPPFSGSQTQVLLAHVESPPVPPADRCEVPIDPDFERLILRALEKTPRDRFGTAAEMRAALHACACFGKWSEKQARDWWTTHEPHRTGRASASTRQSPGP